MPAFELIEQTTGTYYIEGDLTFSSINKNAVKSYAFLKSAKKVCIDFAKVNSADSAGLALLIEWIKHSKVYNTNLTYKNIPHQLYTLGSLSGLDLNEYLLDINQE